MPNTMKKRISILLAFLLCCAGLSQGQRPTDSSDGMAGRVTDGRGTPLPGMAVFAEGIGVKRETITNPDGSYRLTLPPGNYEIRAGTNCNQTSYQKDVEVESGKITTLDLVIPLYQSYAADISIYQLISEPERFQGRPVTISGYYRFGP